MKRRFLFRLDGSKDNDDFFTQRRGNGGTIAYSGTTMSVGPGWIPDLIEVEIGDAPADIVITLIELEAADITARVSCRKYLPEPSTEIVNRLIAYLDTVARQCQGTADPRLHDFESLKAALSRPAQLSIRTAGALRSSPDFLESFTLLDQPGKFVAKPTPIVMGGENFPFKGTCPLSREATDGLRRAVRILHEVVTDQDHSAGTIHSWRNRRHKPLDKAVAKNQDRFCQLHQLFSYKHAAGMKLECDQLAQELANLWTSSSAGEMTAADVAAAIRRFVPVAMGFSNQASMRKVYDDARAAVGEGGTG